MYRLTDYNGFTSPIGDWYTGSIVIGMMGQNNTFQNITGPFSVNGSETDPRWISLSEQQIVISVNRWESNTFPSTNSFWIKLYDFQGNLVTTFGNFFLLFYICIYIYIYLLYNDIHALLMYR